MAPGTIYSAMTIQALKNQDWRHGGGVASTQTGCSCLMELCVLTSSMLLDAE